MEHPLASHRRNTDPEPERELIHLSDPRTERLIDALSCATTRQVLDELYEHPRTASELAARLDHSLQNVQYHLRKLKDRGLIEVVETTISEKGRRMDVYGPSMVPVIVAGAEPELDQLPVQGQ